MLPVDILGRRRPDATHDKFTAYWRDVHAQLGCAVCQGRSVDA
jgi:hypothetical protein